MFASEPIFTTKVEQPVLPCQKMPVKHRVTSKSRYGRYSTAEERSNSIQFQISTIHLSYISQIIFIAEVKLLGFHQSCSENKSVSKEAWSTDLSAFRLNFVESNVQLLKALSAAKIKR